MAFEPAGGADLLGAGEAIIAPTRSWGRSMEEMDEGLNLPFGGSIVATGVLVGTRAGEGREADVQGTRAMQAREAAWGWIRE
jgi:hypothetical protein